MKKLKITINIPVFNEEKCIINLVKQLKEQKGKNFKIEGIQIYSDGSTDETVSRVRNTYKNIKIFNFEKNLGKSHRLNQILSSNKADILIIVDADIKLKRSDVIYELIKKYNTSGNPEIVCAYHRANKPKTFTGKLAYFGYKVWDRARNSLGKNGLRYYCEGGMIAYSKKIAKEIKFPEKFHIGDDIFSFYYAISHGYKVVVSNKSKVYIDLPEDLIDYTRQMKRFLTDPIKLNKVFNPAITKEFETMNNKVKFFALTKELINSPVIGVCYLFLQSIVKIQMIFHNQTINWEPIKR